MRRLLFSVAGIWLLSVFVLAAPQSREKGSKPGSPHAPSTLFQPSDDCLACHNNLRTASGEDVSIGADWRATMMANSSRDPYWQASVRREVADHTSARSAIEDECSVCHMPMARTLAHANGRTGEIFAHLPVAPSKKIETTLAHDGVSCTACHQITNQKLGTADSFTGGYVIDVTTPAPRPMFGPFQIDKGRTTIMRSSSGFQPTESTHVQQSELCATCHTLYTTALDAQGREIGRLPEQMPYLEWRHSDFAATDSCQACHMPAVPEDTPIASVLGEPRRLARHFFRGGNFFVLRMLNQYRNELGVAALPAELERTAARTVQHLQSETAAADIERAVLDGAGHLQIDVRVQNKSGHKFPTGYPSRRAWLHLIVRDAGGRIVFESGAVAADGQIEGNDNDRDPRTFEPHYAQITRRDEVQIYESVMVDAGGIPTTGLLSAVRFGKDNRLLPRGFDKGSAVPDIAVVGEAGADADFVGGGDHVRYLVDVAPGGVYDVDVELRFQPIAYRWAQNLKPYDSSEARRFVSYYDSMAPASSEILARSTARASSSNR